MFCEGGGSLSEATFPDCRKTAPPAQTLSRRQLLVAAGAGAASLAFPKLASSARSFPLGDSVVLQWNEAFLQGVRNSRLGPPMVAVVYFNPRLTFVFLVLLACAAFADWLASRMSPQPPK